MAGSNSIYTSGSTIQFGVTSGATFTSGALSIKADSATDVLTIGGPSASNVVIQPSLSVNGVTIGASVGVVSANLSGYVNVSNGNEMTLANGFAGGSLYLNYRGASAGITEVRICNGLSTGALANVTCGAINATSVTAPFFVGVASNVTISYNNGSNSAYQVLFGSGTGVYGSANITMNPYTGALTAAGPITGSTVSNAVWNDIADFVEIEEDQPIEFGRVYMYDGQKHRITKQYAEQGALGLASDTYGFGVGKKAEGIPQIPIAIGGYALAYVDAIYPSGTALVCNVDGGLTKANWLVKLLFPERILATFYKVEKAAIWNQKVVVNGRSWVKVR